LPGISGWTGPALKDIGVQTMPMMSEDRRYRRNVLIIAFLF